MSAKTMIALMCLPVFFFHLKPSEAFLTRFLEDDKQLSREELNRLVWPADVYGSLALMIPAGLLAELAGYKFAIAFSVLLREMTRLMLLFSPPRQVGWAVALEVTYAGSSALNAVYYALPMALLEPRYYAAATAALHASYHGGSLLGSALAQLLVSTGAVVELRVLFILSAAFTTAGGVAFAGFLLYLRRVPPTVTALPSLFASLRRGGFAALLRDLSSAYKSREVALWSVASVFSGAGWLIISNYVQGQLKERGLVSLYGVALLALEVAFVLSAIPVRWLKAKHHKYGGPLLVVCASLACCVYLVAPLFASWPLALVANTLGAAVYGLMSTAGGAVISQASNADRKRLAFVFTVNGFLALVVATVAQQAGVAFASVGTDVYFYLVSIIYGALACTSLVWTCVSRNV